MRILLKNMETHLNKLVDKYYTNKTIESYKAIISHIDKNNEKGFIRILLSEQTHFFLTERKVKIKLTTPTDLSRKSFRKSPRWGDTNKIIREEIKTKNSTIIRFRLKEDND